MQPDLDLPGAGAYLSVKGVRDIASGLFVPVELLLLEEDHDRSSLTYVRPSSLMVVDDNPPLRAAALALDDKLAALAAKVSASKLADVHMGGAV